MFELSHQVIGQGNRRAGITDRAGKVKGAKLYSYQQ